MKSTRLILIAFLLVLTLIISGCGDIANVNTVYSYEDSLTKSAMVTDIKTGSLVMQGDFVEFIYDEDPVSPSGVVIKATLYDGYGKVLYQSLCTYTPDGAEKINETVLQGKETFDVFPTWRVYDPSSINQSISPKY